MKVQRQELARHVRMAGRALARSGLVHAFGHCSARLDDQRFIITPPKPMGNVRLQDEPPEVPIVGPLPEGLLGEVRIHQAIYLRRPDVRAVCRVTPFHVELLSLVRRTPRARHGLGVIFDPAVRLWDDPRLLRDNESAQRLAEDLGAGRAIVMRGNGAVIVGADLAEAVASAWLLEDAARIEAGLMQIGQFDEKSLLSPEEVQARRATSAHVSQRLWDFLTSSDEESGVVGASDSGDAQ